MSDVDFLFHKIGAFSKSVCSIMGYVVDNEEVNREELMTLLLQAQEKDADLRLGFIERFLENNSKFCPEQIKNLKDSVHRSKVISQAMNQDNKNKDYDGKE